MKKTTQYFLLTVLLVLLGACGNESPATTVEQSDVSTVPGAAMEQEAVVAVSSQASIETDDSADEVSGPGKFLLTPEEQGLPSELAPLARQWTGDFDGMVERRFVRALVVFSKTNYSTSFWSCWEAYT